jgi:hypothetical protein
MRSTAMKCNYKITVEIFSSRHPVIADGIHITYWHFS